MQDEQNFGAGSGGTTGGTGSGLGSTGSGLSGSTGGSTGLGGSTSSLGGTTTGGTTTGSTTEATTSTSTSRLGGMGELKETLSGLETRADEVREQAAERLETAAERLGEIADRVPQKGVGNRAGAMGHSAADTLESVARFLRDNDVASLQRDLGGLVSQRPLSMLLLAVGAGFVAGKVLR
ncbi:MAG TPA: hypothetical protein VFR37_17110 [Longimicrobium sp.]|nr:hypothetical protein [Longimicrobium sp.]